MKQLSLLIHSQTRDTNDNSFKGVQTVVEPVATRAALPTQLCGELCFQCPCRAARRARRYDDEARMHVGGHAQREWIQRLCNPW